MERNGPAVTPALYSFQNCKSSRSLCRPLALALALPETLRSQNHRCEMMEGILSLEQTQLNFEFAEENRTGMIDFS